MSDEAYEYKVRPYEYEVVWLSGAVEFRKDLLNYWAGKGWELVAVDKEYAYFRRPKVEV